MFPLSQLKPGQFQGGRAEQRVRLLDLEMLMKVGADTVGGSRVGGLPEGEGKGWGRG